MHRCCTVTLFDDGNTLRASVKVFQGGQAGPWNRGKPVWHAYVILPRPGPTTIQEWLEAALGALQER